MPNRSEITTPPPAVIARSKATKQSTVATQQAAMIATLLWDPVLARFRTALAAACTCGDRIERVVLFGSRACGDHQPDTDYDIAVFIKDPDTFGEDAGRLARVTTDILLDTGAVISAMPFRAGAYQARTGFMHELRKDGLDL